MECTGFGFNLLTGNYEFASLIAITDANWWTEYGGHIEANWESAGLRRYSTLDRPAVTALIHDPAWSNEGLFALLQGLAGSPRSAAIAPTFPTSNGRPDRGPTNWYQGNAADDGDRYRGWLLGHFIDSDADGIRHTSDLEVKWGIHAAGQTRPGGWTTGETRTSLLMLISGKCART